jgi:tetratricopeptide (TPR) repeat protein
MHGEREEKELLPWMWAAVRSDPHNVMAAEVTAYWLASRMNSWQEAIAVLNEAIRVNPAAFELELSRGRILFHDLNDVPAAESAFLAARRKYLAAQAAWRQQPAETRGEEPERLLYSRILSHLARISELRGDTAAVIGYYREALGYARNPDIIRRQLQRLEQGHD